MKKSMRSYAKDWILKFQKDGKGTLRLEISDFDQEGRVEEFLTMIKEEQFKNMTTIEVMINAVEAIKNKVQAMPGFKSKREEEAKKEAKIMEEWFKGKKNQSNRRKTRIPQLGLYYQS